MILKKYRIFILLLICITLINFTFEYKAHAEAITISAGLYVFLKAAYAAGLVYIGGQAITKVTKESKELYEEWQKFINNKPPEERPPNDWAKTAILTSLGLQLGDSFKRLVDSVKGFFQELGAKEGDNSYTVGGYQDLELYIATHGYTFNTKKESYISNMDYKDRHFKLDFKLVGTIWKVQLFDIYFYRPKGSTGQYMSNYSNSGEYVINYDSELGYYHFSMSPYPHDKIYNFKLVNPNTEPITEILPEKEIIYNITNNSYITTNNPDDIKPVSPNLAVIPPEKIKEENGQKIYEGTSDDLVDDIINNADPENLFDPSPKQLEEISPGQIKLPNSNPSPNPDPNDPDPDPDTGGGIDLDKIFDPNTDKELNTDKLKKDKDLSLKFPFSIPWDLARVIRLFSRPPSPPDLSVNINNEYLQINHTIDLNAISLPIRFFRYAATAFFVFFLASKTRDLIKW